MNKLALHSASIILLGTILLSATNGNAQQQVAAKRYVVASGHPESTKIGLQVLRSGGNVVDAAVATSMALGVAEPYGSGLGGKLILLYREAKTGRVYSIVALCTAPAELDYEEFTALSAEDRKYGYQAVGVPGLVAGLEEAHRRWGSLPWQELVTPASNLAAEGVTIDEVMEGMFQAKVSSLRQDDEASQLYLVNGRAPAVGTVMKNADLAESLREIATGGPRAFYEGHIAKRIVAAAREGGSSLTLADFRRYRAEVDLPLQTEYRGYRVYSCPPPLTGGATVLAALECLERMELSADVRDSVVFADAMGRTLQCLYPQISRSVADVSGALQSAHKLMNEQQAAKFARLAMQLDPQQPLPASSRDLKQEATLDDMPLASTSHLLVVDAAGNMVSLTQSLSLHFGASVVAPDTGILLNDSLSNFATRSRTSPNFVEPNKRARSTIAPIIATKEGQPWLALGIPGGQRIPTTTLQLLWRLIDKEDTLSEAFAAPRFHLRRPLKSSDPRNLFDYEAGSPTEWVSLMEARGWSMNPRKRNGHYFGGGSAAVFVADGSIVGVADPRRTNFVAGD